MVYCKMSARLSQLRREGLRHRHFEPFPTFSNTLFAVTNTLVSHTHGRTLLSLTPNNAFGRIALSPGTLSDAWKRNDARFLCDTLVYLCNSDRRGVTWTHNNAVVLGKRHLILRTNDNNDTCCIARLFDVLVLINVYRQ